MYSEPIITRQSFKIQANYVGLITCQIHDKVKTNIEEQAKTCDLAKGGRWRS